MSDNTFWAVVWGWVVIVLIAVMLTVNLDSELNKNTMLQMVKEGASPIEARCGVYGINTSADATICSQFTLRSR